MRLDGRAEERLARARTDLRAAQILALAARVRYGPETANGGAGSSRRAGRSAAELRHRATRGKKKDEPRGERSDGLRDLPSFDSPRPRAPPRGPAGAAPSARNGGKSRTRARIGAAPPERFPPKMGHGRPIDERSRNTSRLAPAVVAQLRRRPRWFGRATPSLATPRRWPSPTNRSSVAPSRRPIGASIWVNV